MREKLIELLNNARIFGIRIQEMSFEEATRLAFEQIADHLLANGVIVLPCKVGDTVYRICPKCNDRHDGSCENCAWRGCMTNCGCTTYGLWGDGQFPPDECTIVPYKVFWNYIPNMMEKLGKTVFLTREEAGAALKEGQG